MVSTKWPTSLDRIYNETEIDFENVEFCCDLCNSGKSILTPAAYIKRAFSIVFNIANEAGKKGMTVEEYCKYRWPR